MRYVLAFFIFAIAGCTGGLPTSGQLPTVDGANVSNVAASTVGGVAANDVAAAAKAANAAASDATAGAMVKRDASGNFAAGTITAALNGKAASADYALGKIAADVPSTSNLTVSGGNYFRITGTTDIYTLAAMPPGSRVMLEFRDALTLHHNDAHGTSAPVLHIAGGGNFKTVTDDVFEFLFDGTQWREINRWVSNDSGFVGDTSTATIVDSVWTAMNFANVRVDSQGEYNAATGYFTFKQAGTYLITAQMSVEAFNGMGVTIPWQNGVTCSVAVDRPTLADPSTMNLVTFQTAFSTAANFCRSGVTGIYTVAAAERVRVVVSHSTTNVRFYNPNQYYNLVKIIRIK